MTRESREVLDRLFGVISDRKVNPGKGSYTSSLFFSGVDGINQKVLEEACELTEAAKLEGVERVVQEAADLIYHTLVLLVEAGVTLEDVRRELEKREGIGGLEEKAGRKHR